ncbi:helix-turn-helix domain-containing protein [Longispora albida]|uniref:helix-turn-helix domain-containing protein n=1 Tax=Longispora albida TaxID=203523 RepID=UPI0003A882B2|nr:helix-turn-helix transcriptional regulator [Longispora albida]
MRRRRLRFELRRARDEAGLTQDQVCHALAWPRARLIRMEAGAASVSSVDMRALIRLYGLPGTERAELLTRLAAEARQRSDWWSVHRDLLPPSTLDYFGYEAESSVLRQFHPYQVPVLLQSEGYARELIRGGPAEVSEGEADTLVDIRMTRQELVLDRIGPPRVIAILGEAALHIVVGGKTTMAEQLHHLADLAVREPVDVRVVPFSAGTHPGLAGGFVLMEFPDPIDDDVLCLESAENDLLVKDEPEILSRYRQAFDRIAALALPEWESLELIRRVGGAL